MPRFSFCSMPYHKDVLLFLNTVSRCLAYARQNEQNFAESIVTLGEQRNFFLLLPVHPTYVATVMDVLEQLQYIKQGSAEWHLIRDQARVTGSTAYSALGLGGIAEQQEYNYYVINGLSKKLPSAARKSI